MIKTTSLQPILDCFAHQGVRGATELSVHLGKDVTLIHRYLKELVARGALQKVGKGSHAKYTIDTQFAVARSQPATIIDAAATPSYTFSYQQAKILAQYFLKFAPNGKRLQGTEGFATWCQERGLDVGQKAAAFVGIAEHIEKIKNACGLLDVTAHFREHIEGSAIDQLYFVDQYKWMDFGRGKIAELAFYGKDTQHRGLLEECIHAAQAQIECLIHTGKFDAIAITPHSKKRSIQLLKELQRIISWGDIPMIKLVKYAPHGVIVAQKSLKTRQQRIQNAKETILLNDAREVGKYKHVLLLDDFVGSGATLNETAKKLKDAGVGKVTGLALVGNANLSYEVIQEI